MVAVGENASSISHAGSRDARTSVIQTTLESVKYFSKITTFALASMLMLGATVNSLAAPASTALPTGASVAQGQVSISQTANTLTVNQTSNQAIVNWNSFDIGSSAKVNIVQPSANSIQLDRVTGNNASQIFGQLTSNGQVILVNPNGIVFGKDGSVSASSFTASTLGITDADFMSGNYNYSRNGATGQLINHGTIQTANGGYVALLGAKVTNSGKIIVPEGTAYLGAGETITVPISTSGKIKLELTPAAINTAVINTAKGTIVAEGGQVYLQAAALNDAAATAVSTVKNAGSIDVSGAQSGNVALLSDHGTIKVSGSITANSTDANNNGGNIVIGRDADTGILSATTDVSNATLTAKAGFVETSGHYLASNGIKVSAYEWLLDPASVLISSNTSSPAYAYNVTFNANVYNNTASSGTSYVNASDIQTAIGTGTNVFVWSNGGNISMSTPLTLVNNTNSNAWLYFDASNGAGGNVSINNSITGSSGSGHTGTVNFGALSAGGAISVTSPINVNGGVILDNTKNVTSAASATASPGVSVSATTTGSSVSINSISSGVTGTTITAPITATAGAVTVSTTVNAATDTALSISGTSTTTTPLIKASGNVILNSNEGAINIADGATTVNTSTITGVNVTIDNTGSTINSTTGAVTTFGTGSASNLTGAAISIQSSGAQTAEGGITASGNVIINGTNSASLTGISVSAPLSGNTITLNGQAVSNSSLSNPWSSTSNYNNGVTVVGGATLLTTATAPSSGTYIGTVSSAALSGSTLLYDPISAGVLTGGSVSGLTAFTIAGQQSPNVWVYGTPNGQGSTYYLKMVQITYTVVGNKVYAQQTGQAYDTTIFTNANASNWSTITGGTIGSAFANTLSGVQVSSSLNQASYGYTLSSFIANPEIFGSPVNITGNMTTSGTAATTAVSVIGVISNTNTSSGVNGIVDKGTITNNSNGGNLTFVSNAGIIDTGAITLAANNSGVVQNVTYDTTKGNAALTSLGSNLSNITTGTLSYTSGSSLVNYSALTAGAGIATTGTISASGYITLDNTSNIGTNLGTSAIGVNVTAPLTALGLLTLTGTSSGNAGVSIAGNISGSSIQASGATTSGSTGLYLGGVSVITTGTSGTSSLTGTSAATNGGGYPAFDVSGNATVTAGSGTTINLLGNATGSNTEYYTNTRGFRTESGTTLTISGNVNITGSSKSDDGVYFLGSLIENGASSVVNITGTTAGAGGGGGAGVHLGTTTVNNGGSLSVVGAANNTNLTMSSPEQGVYVGGSITGSGGNISIRGTATSYGNSEGVYLANSVTTNNGALSIVGQNLYGSGASDVVLGGNINAGTANLTVQSIGGGITQNASTTLTGKNITLDNTGAGIATSLITDATSNPALTANSTVIGGTLNSSTGAIAAGNGVSGNNNAISLSGSINATGNVNIQGNTASQTNTGVNLAAGSSITTTGASSTIAINSGENIAIAGTITSAGSGGVTITAGKDSSSAAALTASSGSTITQTGSGNVSLLTTGVGNLTPAKIVDSGSGNVILAAGDQIAAGTAAGGQVLTTNTANTVTLTGSDKLLVFSGAATGTGTTSTGNLSVLSSGFGTLSIAAVTGGGSTTNAQLNTAYGASTSITGGSNTQVLFRDNTNLYSLNLGAGSIGKTYGSNDPALSSSLITTGYSSATVSTTASNNTFAAMSASAAIGGLNLSSASRASYGSLAGEQVGTYAYSGINGNSESVSLVSQPNLVISPKALIITGKVASATYDGLTSYNSLIAGAGFTTNGLVAGDAVSSVTSSAIQSGSTIGSGAAITGSGVAQAGSFNYSIGNASGTGLGNYAITYVGNVGTVNKASLSLTGATTTVGYNGATQSNTYTITNNGTALGSSNALGGDSLIITGMGSGRNVLSGGYADNLQVVAGSNTNLNNYSITTTNGNLTINAAALTIAAQSATKVYDGNTSSAISPILTGTVYGADTVSLNGQTYASKNVLGTNSSTLNAVAASISDQNGGSNYAISYQSALGTITPKALTASLTGIVKKTYDGSTSATIDTGNIALSGIVSGETVNVANTTGVTGTYASANVLDNLAGAGSVSATGLGVHNLNAGSGTLLSNYALPAATLTANVGTIIPKALTLTGLAVADKTYDATTTATIKNAGSLSNVVGVDDVSVNGLSVSFGDANAGTNKAILLTTSGLTGSSASNYTLNPVASTTASINKADLTVSGLAGVQRYYTGLTDVAIDQSNATLTGVKGSDSFSIVYGSGTYASADAGVGKTLTISGESLTPNGSSSLSNYNVHLQTTAIGTVDKARITAKLDDQTTTYGTVGALTYTVNGLVNNETVSTAGISIVGLSSTGYTGTSTTNNVGVYDITAQSVGSTNYKNYALTDITTGKLTITPATLTFTADGGAKLVTQADPALTYSTSGLVNGDTASVITSGPTLTRAAGELAGTYAISMSGGSASNNYTISNVVPATSSFKIYGAQTLLITMNDLTTTYGTFGNSTIKSVQYLDTNGTTFKTLTNTGGSWWSDGVGGTISITPGNINILANTSVGSYAGDVTAITNGLATSNGNFTSFKIQGATYNITKAPLTIEANSASRIYDGSYFTGASATATGLMNGETIAGLGGLTFTGDAINSRNVGSYTINSTASTPSNFGNYAITYQSGILTTSQKQITLSGLTLADKVYDGTTTASISNLGSLAGIVSGDTVNVLAGAANFADANAGINKSVNLTSLGLTGTSANNYTLVSNNGGAPSLVYSASITPKTITAGGVTAQDKTYDTTTSATLNTGTIALNGVLAGDQNYVNATTSGLTGTFADANAGTNKVVSITGYGLSGSLAGNYQFANGYTTSANASIGQANATISTASSLTGNTYNGGQYSLSVPVISGVYASDSVGTTQTGNSGTNAGRYKTTTVLTGDATTLNNYKFTVNEGTLVIDKANLTVSANQGNNLVFNGQSQNQTDTVSGLVAGDNITVNGLVSARNAGNYYSNLSLSGNATTLDNYNVSLNNASFNIAQAQISANTASSSVTYNGQTQSLAAPTIVGIIAGTDVQVAQTGTSLKNVGSTTSSTILIGADANNYALNAAEGTLTINKANVAIQVNSGSTVYDGTTHQTSGYAVTSGTVFGSDNLGVSGDGISGRNAGSYSSNAVSSNGNYNVSIANGTLNIAKADLTLTANTDMKVFDGTTASNIAVSTSPLGAGDSISTLSQSFSSKNVLGAGNSIINVNPGYVVNDGNGGNNYNTAALRSAAGTITPAQITVSATSDTKVYDGTTTSMAVPTQSAGTIYGQDSITTNGQAFSSKNVMGSNGSTINANAVTVNDGNNGNNYAVTYQSAAGTITPAQILIKAGSDTKTYDGTTDSSAAQTLSSGSIQSGDSITFNGQTFASKDVLGTNNSTLNANQVAINDGNNGNNYAVTYQSNTGTITPLSTTVSITGASTTYNGANQSVSGYTVSNLIAGDSLNVIGDTISGRNAGTYVSNASASNSNYAITVNQGSLNIGKLALTIAANTDTKLYDSTTNSSVGPTVGTLAGGDSISGVSQSFDSKNVLGTGNSSLSVNPRYTINDGNSGNNYVVSLVGATGSITPVTLNLAALADSKVYDSTVNSIKPVAVSGILGTDTVSATQAFNSPNVLTANTTFVNSYVVNDGNNGANYNVVTTTAVGSITPVPVVISGIRAQSKIYDGNTNVVLDTSGLTTSGVVSGESIVTTVAGQFDTPSVGTSKQVSLMMLNSAGVGTNLSNYNIMNQAVTTADIKPAQTNPVNPVSPITIPNSSNSSKASKVTLASSGFTGASAEDAENCNEKRACKCESTAVAGVDICYSDHTQAKFKR